MAHAVGLELLDHDAVEERAQVVAGHGRESLRPRRGGRPDCRLRHRPVRGYLSAACPALRNATGPRAPRIRDVAERAGVGVGTVSRVLNDAPGVAAATRERVRAVMDELGYSAEPDRAQPVARAHADAGRHRAVLHQPSVVERLRGIDEVVGASAYDLTIFNIETPDQRRAGAAALRAPRPRRRGDRHLAAADRRRGARAAPRRGAGRAHRRAARALPTCRRSTTWPAGAMAACHLLEAGHREIAFVGDVGEQPVRASPPASGGCGACAQRLGRGPGRGCPRAYVRRGPFGRETAVRLTRELLALRRPPTAIFAASDIQAFGVLDAAAARGPRRCPATCR